MSNVYLSIGKLNIYQVRTLNAANAVTRAFSWIQKQLKQQTVWISVGFQPGLAFKSPEIKDIWKSLKTTNDLQVQYWRWNETYTVNEMTTHQNLAGVLRVFIRTVEASANWSRWGKAETCVELCIDGIELFWEHLQMKDWSPLRRVRWSPQWLDPGRCRRNRVGWAGRAWCSSKRNTPKATLFENKSYLAWFLLTDLIINSKPKCAVFYAAQKFKIISSQQQMRELQMGT